MIGVPTPGFYFGHSMPPTLPKSPKIEHTQKNVIKNLYFKILQKKISIIIYIYQMNKILDVMEDIKQNITDNQYRIIMDSLMEINKIETKNKILKVLLLNVLL